MSRKIKIRRLKVIAGADFSAQEPRVMSSLCGERELIDGYNLRTKEFPKGKDFYAMLASSAYGKDYWECTEFDQNGKFNQEGKNRRQDGKVIQLGVSYGMGTKLLVENLNKKKKPGEEKMTIEQGQAMMESFFGKFASLRAWKDYNMARLEQFGYMETALGRRRRLYDTWLPDYEIKALSIEPIEDIFFNMDLKVKLVEGTELSKFPASILVEDGTRTKEIVNRLNSISNPFKKKDLIADLEKDPLNRIKSNGGFKSRPKTQATNFCISGDTRVITPEGVKEVKDLSGKVEVWDGEKFTTGTVVKTGFRPHYRVVFEDGNYVDCSPEHPFCQVIGSSEVWTPAEDLKFGDNIKKSRPVSSPTSPMEVSVVKEVIDLGEEIEMYDIVNTGSGYFVGNSLVLHNCVQGGSAELTKGAMVAIYNHPDKERLGIGILAPVHDEILIEGYAEYREEVLKTLSSCMSNSAVGIYEVNMICDGVVESQWNLGHFCDKIQKEFKKLISGDSPLTKEQALEKIYDNYPEISEESLKSIVEGTLDVELDRLKVRKL